MVFLDITASHEKRETIVELARRTADNVFMPFTIGGGIRSVADAQAVLDAGADKVGVNSAALARPELIGELADAGSGPSAWWSPSMPSGRAEARTSTSRAAEPRRGPGRPRLGGGGIERGAGEILLTSMDRDGTSDGYDLELTRAVADAMPMPVIASGGVGKLGHLGEGTRGGADAGRWPHQSSMTESTPRSARPKRWLAADGIPVRL